MGTKRIKSTKTPAPVAAPVIAAKRTIEKNRAVAHGVTRPSAGGKCRVVWDACDMLRTQGNGTIPSVTAIKQYATDNGWNVNNAQIEYYAWRKHNGIRGRTAKATEAPTVSV